MEGKGTYHHQFALDLMTGAIGRLLPKLVDFLNKEHNLQTRRSTTIIKKDTESLEVLLRRMEDACRMPDKQVDQQEDKHWSYQMRELTYDIEDIVDNLMVCIDQGKGKQVAQTLKKNKKTKKSGTCHHQSTSFIRETLDNIKVLVENLAAWRAANFVPTTSTRSTTVDPCHHLEDGFKQVRQLVGIHKIKDKLISRISSSSQGLKIVSIWAAGGMGKTTLAKAVYENIKGDFQYAAFVSLGTQPDMKKAMRDILIYLDKQKYSDLNMTILDEQQLIDELRHFLEKKRFLIIIDDIRDIPSWERIKGALVDNGRGSRIITTSRVLGVAESSGEALQLMPLSIDGSKELFYSTLLCGRVCGSTINFDQLDEQTTEYILQECGCVPLAIIMMASLLAGKPQDEWSEVYRSIGFGQGDNSENITRKIIRFSYYDLPSHLKACLLYLSIFPDDHVIEKDTLLWRWVAEGFVHEDEEQGESLFKVGERYLYQLVSRSMIQQTVEINNNEDTNSIIMGDCRVEAMVLEWIRTVAKEEKLVTAVSGYWYQDNDECLFCHQSSNNNARTVAIHNIVSWDSFKNIASLDEKPHDQLLTGVWKQKVRSFSGTGCSISCRTLLHPTFQALRVLSLEGCKLITADGRHLMENLVVGLVHLRYLGLRGTGIQNLPIGIHGLRYLQTLDLTKTYIRELPISVTQLTQLKCLRCFTSTRLVSPKGMGNLTSLEELRLGRVHKSPNFAKELSKLTKLRVLHIVTRKSCNGKWMEALVESLSKLQRIEELELFCNWRSGDMTCRHVIAPGAFPKMRHLRANTWLLYQPGAMPCLKSVELQVNVHAFNDANFDFHDLYKLSYLGLLEKAHVRILCWEATMEEVELAEAALRRVLQSHPNHPKLILTRFGQCVEECANYKQIRFLDGLHSSGVLVPQAMPLELLRETTNDFCDKQVLGSGTFGTVYKGVINGKEVAVKLLHPTSQRLNNYEEDFMKEFENLRRLNHPNIVQLLGYCYEIKRVCIEHKGKYVLADKIDRALCFEYMHNKSLQRHLDDESHGLDWHTRYNIIKGACEGLKYLHKGLEKPMFHLDLKPGNILLDKNMVPKLADFGLSKLVCDNQTRATPDTLGTIGYCPPEHIEKSFVSDKFDIFSLGVIMLEIIAGPKDKVVVASQEFDQVEENWIKRIHRQATTTDCASPKCECYQVKRCIEIALECVHPKRTQRPDIEDIISRLNETKKILRNQPRLLSHKTRRDTR